ncbi:MAG: hypothetical protein R3C04_03995 [Hyphomonas sp.]
MNRVLKALVPTVLLTEIAGLTFFTATWSILAELHFPNSVILGGEVVTALGVLAIAVAIYRRAYR